MDTTTDYSPNGRDTEVRRPVVMRLCYLAARFHVLCTRQFATGDSFSAPSGSCGLGAVTVLISKHRRDAQDGLHQLQRKLTSCSQLRAISS